MIVINLKCIAKFLKKHTQAKEEVSAWLALIERKSWKSIEELKADWKRIHVIWRHEDVARVVFKLRNEWRIDTLILFTNGNILIKRADTHEAYNKWKYD